MPPPLAKGKRPRSFTPDEIPDSQSSLGSLLSSPHARIRKHDVALTLIPWAEEWNTPWEKAEDESDFDGAMSPISQLTAATQRTHLSQLSWADDGDEDFPDESQEPEEIESVDARLEPFWERHDWSPDTDISWKTLLQAADVFDPEEIPEIIEDDLASQYAEALRRGYSTLAKTVWEHVSTPASALIPKAYFREAYRDIAERNMMFILGSLPFKALVHLIDGNLPRAIRDDYNLRQLMSPAFAVGAKHVRIPIIYGNYITDQKSLGLTGREIHHVAKCLRRHADLVDRQYPITKGITTSASRNGARRYLGNADDGYAVKIARYNNLKRFKFHLERRFPRDARHTRPLAEFGWTVWPHQRLAQHRAHKSSNYLMNLTEAILSAEDIEHELVQVIITYVYRPEHAAPAEAAATELGQGYIWHGSGFSHTEAGRSTQSASTLGHRLWEEKLVDAHMHTEYSLLNRNALALQAVNKKRREARQKLEELRRETEALEKTARLLARLYITRLKEEIAEIEAEADALEPLYRHVMARDDMALD